MCCATVNTSGVCLYTLSYAYAVIYSVAISDIAWVCMDSVRVGHQGKPSEIIGNNFNKLSHYLRLFRSLII
jgi:hypothetical protein